jgi:hypothetical protein
MSSYVQLLVDLGRIDDRAAIGLVKLSLPSEKQVFKGVTDTD